MRVRRSMRRSPACSTVISFFALLWEEKGKKTYNLCLSPTPTHMTMLHEGDVEQGRGERRDPPSCLRSGGGESSEGGRAVDGRGPRAGGARAPRFVEGTRHGTLCYVTLCYSRSGNVLQTYRMHASKYSSDMDSVRFFFFCLGNSSACTCSSLFASAEALRQAGREYRGVCVVVKRIGRATQLNTSLYGVSLRKCIIKHMLLSTAVTRVRFGWLFFFSACSCSSLVSHGVDIDSA